MTKKKTRKIEREHPNPDTLQANMEQVWGRDYDGSKSIGDLLRKPDRDKEPKP